MPRRDDWIDEALTTIAREGIAGVRIDRMADRLGVTKGSFHHHFAGARAMHAAVLETHRDRQLALVAELGDRVSDHPTVDALAELAAAADARLDMALERGMRSWAAQDADAAATVAAIDAARLAVLEEVWSRAMPPDVAHTAALLPHLVLIGATSTATTPAELADAFAMLATLAEAVPGSTDA